MCFFIRGITNFSDTTIFMNTAFGTSLEGCRNYLLSNLGVIKKLDIDTLGCLIDENENFDRYFTIHAKGLLPVVKDLETLAKFVSDYENRQCKTREAEEMALHPYAGSSVSDYSTDRFFFNNWGPGCMIEADKWPISSSSQSKDGFRCKTNE